MTDERELLLRAVPYIREAYYAAEAKHDTYGDCYMDGVQYEIMEDTQQLLGAIALLTGE